MTNRERLDMGDVARQDISPEASASGPRLILVAIGADFCTLRGLERNGDLVGIAYITRARAEWRGRMDASWMIHPACL